MAQKRIDYYGRFTPTGVDTAQAERLQALAGVAESIGDVAFQIGAGIAKQRGAEAGAQAGIEAAQAGQAPETREGFLSSISIYDQQYNAAMESSYLAQISSDARNEIARIATESPDDVVQFMSKADQYRSGIVEGMDERFSTQVNATINNFISSTRNRVSEREIAKNRSTANSIRISEIDASAGQASRYARDGDLTQAELELTQANTIIDSMVASGDMEPDVAARAKRENRREVTEQAFKGELDQIIESDGFAAAYSRLSEIERPDTFTPDEWSTFTASASQEIARAKSIQDASQAIRSQDISNTVRDYASAKSLGFEVSPEETARVRALTLGTEFQDDFERVNEVAAFSVMSASDRSAAISAAQTGQLADIADYEALITADTQINRLAQQDAYTLGVQQRIITQTPFDITDSESVQKRIEQSQLLSAHYGTQVPIMTSAEAEALSQQVTQMSVDELISTAEALNQAPGTWGLISEKNQAVFSMAGATGDRDLMRRVFTGREKLEGGVAAKPSVNDYLAIFEDYVGDVYGPRDKSAVLQTALAYYADTQIPGEVFDSGVFQESLLAVTGGITEYNGFKIALPRDVTEDDFDTFVDAINEQYIDSLGGVAGYTSAQAVNAIKNGRIKSVGDNQYVVLVNGSAVLINKRGQPLILEYSQNVVADTRANEYARDKLPEAVRAYQAYEMLSFP